MSAELAAPASVERGPWLRLALAMGAVAAVAGGLALIAWAFAAPTAPPPPRNPFGVGVREAAPAAGGFGGWILALQAGFYRELQQAVAALKQSGAAWTGLVGLGFAYGVFHAAGPGHGKAVIAAYLVADDRALRRGFTLSLAAALVQALVALAVVGTLAVLLKATAMTMSLATNLVELASFAAVATLGAALTWRKAGRLAGLLALSRQPGAPVPELACDHAHLPGPDELGRLRSLRETAGVVLAAGLRPCSGAIVVLVFALAQGLFAAGIAATFAMALGTALTTGALAALAVLAKRTALRLAGGRSLAGTLAAGGLELLAAAFVLVLGVSLLAGLWAGAGAS